MANGSIKTKGLKQGFSSISSIKENVAISRHKVTMSMQALKLIPQPEFCEILRSDWRNRYLLDKVGRNVITPTPSPPLNPQFGPEARNKPWFLILSPLSLRSIRPPVLPFMSVIGAMTLWRWSGTSLGRS
jgi:hypothetical protein